MNELIRHSKNSEFFMVESFRKISQPKSTRVAPAKPEWNPDGQWILDEFADVFRTELPKGIPPARPTDMKIELVPEAVVSHKRQYRLGPVEAAELDRQAEHHLEGERCRNSYSEWNSPSIMERKVGTNELRWCVDYRGLNAVTKPDPYPMPIAEHLIENYPEQKSSLRLTFCMDISSVDWTKPVGSTLLSQQKPDIWSSPIVPLGLKNAPATFMRTMHYVFAPLINKCVIIFLDDIAVFSKNREEHDTHLRMVFELMRKHRFYGSLKKCFFYMDEIPYLGYIVGKDGLRTDPSIISTIKEFVPPTNVRGVRTFLGLTGFYRKFVSGYATKAVPLTELLKEDSPFTWTKECQQAFEELRNALIAEPILALPDFSRSFVLTTDAGNRTVAAVLQQDFGKGLQPVRYWSRRMTKPEENYSTTEQEMLALVEGIKTFDYYLYGQHFYVETDHRALVYLFSQPKLSPRQCRWLNTIAGFDFEIKYLEGRKNVVADGLTRMEILSDVTEKPTLEHRFRKVVSSVVDLMATIAACRYSENEVREYQDESKFFKRGSIYFKMATEKIARDRACVPQGSIAVTAILQSLHDEPTGGHSGVQKTLAAVKDRFYWKGLSKDVKDFVTSCIVCQKVQSSQKPAGLLQPITPPSFPWERINWDFVTGFPKTKRGSRCYFNICGPSDQDGAFLCG